MAYFRVSSESGKRERWTVKVKAVDLLERCAERVKYHQSRMAFWKKQHSQAETKLQSEGIQLKHFEVTGGRRTEAQLDPSMAKRVSECEERLKFHQDSVGRFGAFKALFSVASQEEVLDLNVDDVLYFNLAGADIGGDEDDKTS